MVFSPLFYASNVEIPKEQSNMPANHSLCCIHSNPLVPDTSAFDISGMNSPTPERSNAVVSPNACMRNASQFPSIIDD